MVGLTDAGLLDVAFSTLLLLFNIVMQVNWGGCEGGSRAMLHKLRIFKWSVGGDRFGGDTVIGVSHSC